MEREHVLLTGVSICCVLAFAATSASSAVTLPFEDDFENITVGDYPDENGWQNLFSGVNAYVSDGQAHGGSRSFRLESHPNWSRTDVVHIQDAPERISFEVSVYPDPVPQHAARVGFAHASGSQSPFYNFFSIYTVDGTSGTVHFKGPADILATEVGSFSVGTWVTVRADLDFATCTASLWFDGAIVATGVPILPREFDDPYHGHVVLDKFGATGYNWVGGGTGVVYVDDVRIYESPPVAAVIQIQQITEVLSNIVDSNPHTPLAEEIEDVIGKLLAAIDELNKPDNQAATGEIERAVADLEAAVDNELLDAELGMQLMDDLAAIARQLADSALNQAIAQGGDPDVIAEAGLSLLEGDEYRAAGAFKDAVNKYKDALAEAERAS